MLNTSFLADAKVELLDLIVCNVVNGIEVSDDLDLDPTMSNSGFESRWRCMFFTLVVSHIHTRTHARTHACMHVCTHTHTHTHRIGRVLYSCILQTQRRSQIKIKI